MSACLYPPLAHDHVGVHVGVLSAAKLVSRLIGEPASEAVDHALATVLALYADGLVAVSDEQAAGIALLAAATKGEELQGWSQLAVMNLTATAAILKGRVLGLHASPEDALDYTMTKVGMAKSSDPRILAQPSQLLFALFVACKALGMREVPDKMMVAFDRRPIGCFVPDSYLQYHDPQMVMGRNVVQYIGEGMFTVEDFERGFLSEVSQSEERALSELSAVDLAWPVIASAILGDRMPPTSLALST